MDPFAHLVARRKARTGVTMAGLFLAAVACWSLTHAAGAAPLVRAAFTPEASRSVTAVQFGRAGPLARARLKRRLGPGRAGGPKRPMVAPGKFAAPKKTVPPSRACGVRGRPPCPKTVSPTIVTPPPTCGVRGRPPCPKTVSPTIVTPPPSGCKGTHCPPPSVCHGSNCPPPGGPGVIVTPPPLPPGGGGFGTTYLAALPRIAEGARANPGPVLYGKQVLVLIDQAQPAALEDTLAQQYNLQRLNDQTLTLIAARAQLYAIPDGRTVAALVSVLGADPRVRLAQGNFAYRRQGETGKTQAEAPQYALSKMSVAPAHEMALGRGVRIAVIDSAIDAAHPDLAGAVLNAFDATNRSADTGDGHGTAVAGIIAARGTVRGVAPMAEILAVRAFAPLARQQPIASSSVILLRAIEWSVVNGAQVLNMSFVGPRDPAVQAMIEAAQKRSAVIVAAAGNGGSSAPPAYPAAYPGVIAVTAIDAADKRYAHANRGTYIAISAPGVDILAPADGGRHAFLSGTSFAAAHVSGIVALLLERSRSLQPEGALAALSDNAVDLGPTGRDDDFGFGRADAFAALRGLPVRK